MRKTRLPRNWAKTTLGEICWDKVEQGPPGHKSVQYVDISSINRERKKIGITKIVTRVDAPTRARQWVRKGDVLVSMTRPNLNAVALVGTQQDGAVASTGFDILRPLAVLPQWIFRRVCSQQFVADICQGLQGVVYPAVRPHDVRQHEIPIPPLYEQHRIVHAIESYFTRLDDAIVNLERVQRNLKRYRASVLKAAVEGRLVPTEAELAQKEGRDYEPASVLLERILKERRQCWEKTELAKMRAKGKVPKNDKWKEKYREPVAPDTEELPELPEGWCWASVEMIGDPDEQSVLTGPFGTSLGKADFVDEGIRVLTIGCLTKGGIDGTRALYVNAAKAKSLKRYSLRYRDILFSRMATVGRAGYITRDLEGALFNYHIMRLRLQRMSIESSFFINYVRGSQVVKDYVRKVNHGVTRDGINTRQLLGMPVPLPPRNEQSRISSEVDRLVSLEEAQARMVHTATDRLSRLRQGILKWAFEGKLVDQHPSDEPASALLDRIKAERKAASKKPTTPTRRKRRAARA